MSTTAVDTISVVVPCHNGAALVGAAIDSILSQTYPHVQVVVVDDGSTDASAEVIRGYGDRVTALFQENRGKIPSTGGCSKPKYDQERQGVPPERRPFSGL